MKKLTIIIPAYNEAKTIQTVLKAVLAVKLTDWSKELIVVNDHSTDQTREKVQEFLKNHKEIVYLEHAKNQGKGAAVKTGIEKSTGDYLIIQDADLEYNPEEFPLLIEPVEKSGADVVYGSRFITDKPHRVLYYWHSLGNSVLTTYSNMLSNLNITDMETGYKLFNGDLIRKLGKNLESKRFGFEPEITAKIAKEKGLKIYEVGISYTGRTYEEGKHIGWRDGLRAFWEITKYNLL